MIFFSVSDFSYFTQSCTAPSWPKHVTAGLEDNRFVFLLQPFLNLAGVFNFFLLWFINLNFLLHDKITLILH